MQYTINTGVSEDKIFPALLRKTPHRMSETLQLQGLCVNHQPGPQALVEPGDGLRQFLHALDEPFDLPAVDHDLVDLVHDGIAPALGILVPADQRIVALVVLFLVLKKKQATQLTKFAV